MTAVTLTIMLAVLLVMWFVHGQQLEQLNASVREGELATQKLQLCINIIESARARTRLVGQIIFVDDPFEKDRLNLELDGEAATFARARESLLALPLSDYEKILLERQGSHTRQVLPAQREVTAMVMDDPVNNKDEANRLLYEVIFPGQGKIIDEIIELAAYQKSIIDEITVRAASIRRNYQQVQRISYGAIFIIVTILSVVVVRRTARVERQLQFARDDAELAYQQLHEHHKNLEVIVQERTAELERAKDEAITANNAKSEFLSRMSHELRTPMNAILGFAQLLELDELTSTQRDGIGEILKAGNHLLNLINEVLDLAKIEAGKSELSLEAVDLERLLTECISLINPLMTKRGIELSTTIAVSPAMIHADRVRTKQVILNLLSNAVKYNRDGGTIEVVLTPGAGNMLCLSVRDSGPGLSAEKLSHLYDAFNRLGAEQTEVEGTGIGLTISKKLLEMMGGTISATSREGTGSEFSIELPATHIIPATQECPRAATTEVAPGEGSDTTVLYIEDNPANLRLVKKILLARPNITLITAHEPHLGLEFARHHLPRLILLDIHLPEMDGFEVLRRLRGDSSTAQIPVFALSANAMPQDIERAKAAGFGEYLTKPINVSEFLNILDRHFAS